MSGLEAPPDELQVNAVRQFSIKNSKKPKPTSHHWNKPPHYKNQCRKLKERKKQAADTKTSCDFNVNTGKKNPTVVDEEPSVFQSSMSLP